MRVLVSYANKPYFYRSQRLLVETSKPYFDGHASYTYEHLDRDFIEKNKHILSQPRGGGYWLWKPYVILKTLEAVKEGDYVMYVDSGNAFISSPDPLFKICERQERGILLFENRDGTAVDKEVKGGIWQNYMFTKYDCFELMKCNTDPYIYGNQVDGSYVIVRKNKFTLDFMKEYLSYCENEDILTDTPNKLGKNYPGYRDHRHDQSVLSLMAIQYKLPTEREPSEWGNNQITEKSEYKQIFQHHRGLF